MSAVCQQFDVAIVGGGPSGSATAIALARAGRKVVLFERSRYDQVRIGETLPPACQMPLRELGVWDQFVSAGHAPSPGIVSVWGQDQPHENPFILNPYGHGWHLDRRRFDAMLTLGAEQAGATVQRGMRVTRCTPDASSGWRVEFTPEDGGKPDPIQATYLVDATGRASALARRQGTKRINHDHLVAVTSFFSGHSSRRNNDPRTLVEAAKDGWWYSAWLPGGRLIVAYMTDADLLPRERTCLCEHWQKRLEQTTHTKLRVSSSCHPSELALRLYAANSSCLDHVTGVRWLAVGDAAMAFDPLSSQGIVHGLKSGLLAAQAIAEYQSGNLAVVEQFARWNAQSFYQYLEMRSAHYNRETRWPASEFWRRRHQP